MINKELQQPLMFRNNGLIGSDELSTYVLLVLSQVFLSLLLQQINLDFNLILVARERVFLRAVNRGCKEVCKATD